jgi:hypothetical protein
VYGTDGPGVRIITKYDLNVSKVTAELSVCNVRIESENANTPRPS